MFHHHLQRSRIIPALAGNTCGGDPVAGTCEDHPRSRGEYVAPKPQDAQYEGSSPLSRGIHRVAHRHGGNRGIIPALAGNTNSSRLPENSSGDHPRSRGEYVDKKFFVCGDVRIIPALAGNTLVDKGFYQPDLSDLGNPLLARLRFSKSLAPRLRRPPSWRGGSSGSASEGPGRTIRVSPS